MEQIFNIALKISTPLALAGFATAGIVFVFQLIVSKHLIPKLSEKAGSGLLKTIIDRFTLIVVLALAAGLLGAGFGRIKRPLEYRGAVMNSGNDTITNANVTLLGYDDVFPKTTDEHGSFDLKIMTSENSIEADVQVTHPDYKTARLHRKITRDAQPDLISLERKTPAIAQPVQNSQVQPKQPKYETKYFRTDPEGRPYYQLFNVQTENRHGRSDIIASGTQTISNSEGRIYSVEYSCQGYPCGWSYNPNGGYDISYQISGDQKSFTWFRKWDGDRCIETYKALFEVPRQVPVD